jgi:Type IV secretory pathway, VirB11 components, and related ATPases involved in archaeal flagella biosynthesis
MSLDPAGYLENSFLSELIQLEGLTDLSFNGEELFYATNQRGREKAKKQPSLLEVGDFLRQMANLTEKQFSYSSPILDVSFSRYRLNAVYQSLARSHNEKTYSFSLRLASPRCRIAEDPRFFGGESKGILQGILARGESIVIGGKTSSGKTELEKYLLGEMAEASRVIVIDNVEELDMVANPKIDLTMWLVNESIKEASFSGLIRNALRNNPDYIMVAEARGGEMLDALVSAMSGHPIITTIHAQDLEAMPERIARLAMMGNPTLYKEELMDDIAHHLRYYVYLEKKENPDGSLSRSLASIGYLDEKSKCMHKLYERTS